MALFYPEFELRTRCVLRIFQRVPPKRSISFASFPQNRLLWIWTLRSTTLDLCFSQNRNCSLRTLTVRPLAGFLFTISMSTHAIIAINAPASRLVVTTHGRMPTITRRFSTSCLHQRQGILAPVAGLASRLFERLSSVCLYPVGTEEDACSLPFRLRSLSTAGFECWILQVFFAPSADVSRFTEACECRKLQESPFEQDPVVFRLVKEFGPFPFSYGHTLCNLCSES